MNQMSNSASEINQRKFKDQENKILYLSQGISDLLTQQKRMKKKLNNNIEPRRFISSREKDLKSLSLLNYFELEEDDSNTNNNLGGLAGFGDFILNQDNNDKKNMIK